MADYFSVYYNEVNYVEINGTESENDPLSSNRSCTYNQGEEGSYIISSRCDFEVNSIEFFASRDKGILKKSKEIFKKILSTFGADTDARDRVARSANFQLSKIAVLEALY